MRFKSFIQSIAGLSLSLLVLLAALACPASVQSDEAAPDTKTSLSKLSVTPRSLSYNVNIGKGVFSETKHFDIANEGTAPLKVVVNTPSNPAYVIKSGAGTATIPGKVKGNKADQPSTVEVEFIPNGAVKSANGTINVISDATSGKSFAIVKLSGKSRRRLQTRTATPTATATATETATATATRTATVTTTATLTATATAAATGTVSATRTATATPTATATGGVGVSATGSNAGGGFGAWSPTTVSLYSGTTNGNLVMVMLCVSGTVTTFTPPAGYSQLGSIAATATGGYCGLFYHVWSTGDPVAVSFADSYAASTERDYITATYSGENTNAPFDPSKTPSGPGSLSGAALTLSAMSPSNSGDLLASFWAEANDTGGSPTAAYTSPLAQMASYQLASSWNEFYVANGALKASGSTGNKAASFSLVPSGGVGFMIAIQPASGATPTPTATATATATATTTSTTATATATDPMPTATASASSDPTPTATASASSTAATTTATPSSTPTPNSNICSVAADNANTGFKWLCPQADTVCKVTAEDIVNVSSGIPWTKYGSNARTFATAWGSSTGRLANMGVNTAGQYSYSYQAGWSAGDELYMPTEDMGLYSQQDRFGWHVKDAQYVANPNGMKCNGSGYYNAETPDSFDPEAQTAFNALWSETTSPASIYVPSTAGQVRAYVPDDGDSLFLFDSAPTHPDGAYVIAANSPVQVTSAPAVGGTYKFPNATYWAKIGMADYLAGEYGCVGSAVSISSASANGYIVTAQAANSFRAGEMVVISGMSPSGYNNGGYPVLVMPQGLSGTQFQYVVTTAGLGSGSGGSVAPVESALVSSGTDPIGLASCGSTKIASSLSALNTAWSTSYTTWGTTDAGGMAGITAGSYSSTSWSNGSSSGLLDENGSHILKSSVISNCSSANPTGINGYYAAWGKTATLESDLHQFMGLFAGLHMLQHYVGYHAACGSTCPPLADFIYDGPNEAYQQASPYLDVVVTNVFYYATLANAVTRLQTILNNDAGKPVIVENYSEGVGAGDNSCYTSSLNNGQVSYQCPSPSLNQSTRGAQDAAQYAAMNALTNPLGRYAVIGDDHWGLFDYGAANGIVTPNDNYYDGSQASTASTSPAWVANHTYTTPQIVSDGTNKESLMLTGEAGQTCVSGSSAPTWQTHVGQFTTDGSCTWNNIGAFSLTPEAANYGDYLKPVAGYFKTMNQTEPCDAAMAPAAAMTTAAATIAIAASAASGTAPAAAPKAIASANATTGTATARPTNTARPAPTATAGVGAGVWRLEPTASGFEWVSPDEGAVCKFAGVAGVDYSNLTRAGQDPNVVPDKYPSWGAWAQAQSERLKSWGFNAAGQYSYKYYGNAPSGGVPSEVTVQVSGHAVRDDGSYYHCKAVNYDYGAMVCGSSFYRPSGGGQADAFDSSCAGGAGIAGAYLADLGAGGYSNLNCPSCGLPAISAIELVTTEEADNLYGINSQSHEDFGYVVAARNPMMRVSPNGYRYPNATLDAKIALRDWLAYSYGCSQPGGGVGTPMTAGDDLHPATAYCGSSNAANALSALNAAWGTSYTTWGTSDARGEAGIKSGAYNSYGSGTGLLDEGGSHILALSYRFFKCSGILVGNTWSTKPRIEIDLHYFVAYFAQTYAQKLSAGWAQPSANPHPPIFLPLYDGPSYVYSALAPYFDGFWVNPMANDPSATTAQITADLQRIIAASSVTGGKSMPIIISDYASANPDSPFPAGTGGSPQCTTQATRGNGMVSIWDNTLHLQDANSKYVVVGLEHWSFYDQANEGWNSGLVTADHDNPYDGSADIANGEAQNYGDALSPLSSFLNAGVCDP